MRSLIDLWFRVAARIESSWNVFLILHIALLGVHLAKRVRFGLVPSVVFLTAYAMVVYVNASGLLFSYRALNALAQDIHEAHASARFLPDSRRFLAYLAEHGGAEDYLWRIAITHGVAAAHIGGPIASFDGRSLEDRPALWALADLRRRIARSLRRPWAAAAAPPSTPAAGVAASADRGDAALAGPADPAPPENR